MGLFESDSYNKLMLMKDKFKKDGMPDRIALYKSLNYLTPEKLERINLIAKGTDNLHKGITFFFDNKKDIELIAKYFKLSMEKMQVGDSSLLIDILKMLEE